MKVQAGSRSRWITSASFKAGRAPVHEHLKQMFSVYPGKIELDGGRIKLDVASLEKWDPKEGLFRMRVTLDLKGACVDLGLDELSDHLFDHVAGEIMDLLPHDKKAGLGLFPLKENDLSRVVLTISIESSRRG